MDAPAALPARGWSPDPRRAVHRGEWFGLIGDPARVRIPSAPVGRGKPFVGDLATDAGETGSSHTMLLLRAAGMVRGHPLDERPDDDHIRTSVHISSEHPTRDRADG